MYLIDPNTTFKFGIKKIEGKYLPIQIKEDSEIKEGQIVFEAKAYTAKEVIEFNSLPDPKKYDFIKNRTKCNMTMDYMLPIVLEGVNWFIMGLSVRSEEDERLFI